MNDRTTVNVTLCTGTTCYVMGAAELMDELNALIATGKVPIEVVGAGCLGQCKRGGSAVTPVVKIGDRIVAPADAAALRAELLVPAEAPPATNESATDGAETGGER